jgi:hypothetical protein
MFGRKDKEPEIYQAYPEWERLEKMRQREKRQKKLYIGVFVIVLLFVVILIDLAANLDSKITFAVILLLIACLLYFISSTNEIFEQNPKVSGRWEVKNMVGRQDVEFFLQSRAISCACLGAAMMELYQRFG